MEDENRSSPAMGTLSPYFKTQRLPDRPSNVQHDSMAPTLMQRQKSSAIDVTAFSFAKPAARQGGFSLRALPKQSLITSGLNHTPVMSEPQEKLREETGFAEVSTVVNDR